MLFLFLPIPIMLGMDAQVDEPLADSVPAYNRPLNQFELDAEEEADFCSPIRRLLWRSSYGCGVLPAIYVPYVIEATEYLKSNYDVDPSRYITSFYYTGDIFVIQFRERAGVEDQTNDGEIWSRTEDILGRDAFVFKFDVRSGAVLEFDVH